MKLFSECKTSTEQVDWIASRAKRCPFCDDERVVICPPSGKERMWEIGCVGGFFCIGPRSFDDDAMTALRRWNMRGGK